MFSDFFEMLHMKNGVKHGAVLSPKLFTVVLDGLFDNLLQSGVGCRIDNIFAGAFGYAEWGPNEVVVRDPRHTPPPPPQIALKWCATVSVPLRINYRSLPARPKRKMMSVVRAYEGHVLDGGLGSAIKISCPSYLGPNLFLVEQENFVHYAR